MRLHIDKRGTHHRGGLISKEPRQVGSILGQDYIRLIGLVLMGVGAILYALGWKTLTTWLGL